MRSLLLYSLLWFSGTVSAQHHIALHLSQRLGTEPFALNTVATSPAGVEFKVTRLQYYVSQIVIRHDGGQETPATDVYLLVNPALDSVYDLGEFADIDVVEGLRFSIGVDQAHNHLDPASYDPAHPLAPQNPSMHWGWTPGYRFVALEGKAGTNFIQTFEIHTVGDANYRTIEIATPAAPTAEGQEIHLIADYTKTVKNINVATGPIVHGSTGAAVTLVNNMKNEVFTAAAVSMVVDPAFAGSFALAPNPAAVGQLKAMYSLPVAADYRMTVTDLTGRVVARESVDAAGQAQGFTAALQPGTYFVHLWQDGRPVVVEKIVITW
jgi:hypothetical protein